MAEGWRTGNIELKSKTREEIMALCHAQNPTWAKAEWGSWADSKLQMNLDAFKGLASPRTSWQDAIRKITCPVLLITGDPEMGAIITPETAQEAAGLWRNGKVAHIDGAGHNIRREQFDKYVEAVTAFLEKSSEESLCPIN
jgi:pimeloyl-ACP methyl ester carboxylesterase